VFDDRFPNIAELVARDGPFELGESEDIPALIRAYDPGGTIYEGKSSYPTLEAALQDLEKNLVEWLEETG